MKYLLIALLFVCNLTYGQYSLALNLEKGNTYFLKINATLHFNGEMNGQKMSITSEMTGMSRFKVVKASDQEYELEASYDSLHMTIKSPMGRMDFSSGSSSSQDNDMASGALNMLASKHFNITLLKNGAVEKIVNPDTAGFSSIMKNFPMADGIKKMFLMGHLKHSLSKEAMKENMEKLTAIFPNKKVNLNETWGSEIKPDSGSDNTIKTSYQLIDFKGGVATIKGHSESKGSHTQKAANGFPGSMYEMNGNSESTIQVDATTGWIKQADIKNELKGQVEIKGPGMKEGKPVPIEMISSASISS